MVSVCRVRVACAQNYNRWRVFDLAPKVPDINWAIHQVEIGRFVGIVATMPVKDDKSAREIVQCRYEFALV